MLTNSKKVCAGETGRHTPHSAHPWFLDRYLGIHFFISKIECYFESLGYVMGRWAVSDLSSYFDFIRLYVILKFYSINSQIIEYCVLRAQSIEAQFKVPNYRTALVSLPEKVASLKALVYDRSLPGISI